MSAVADQWLPPDLLRVKSTLLVDSAVGCWPLPAKVGCGGLDGVCVA